MKTSEAVATTIGFVGALFFVIGAYALGAAFLWNDWGVDFSSWFNAKDLTFKQALGAGMLMFVVRFRLPKQEEKKNE